MPVSVEQSPGNLLKRGRTARAVWFMFGMLLLGLGFIGIFVPLLPTTDFLILALPCFARSSPRLEAWLLNHPRFGPGLRAWRDHGAIPHHAKLIAWAGMALGYGLFLSIVHPGRALAVIVAILMGASALWVGSRPEPMRNRASG